MCTGRSAAGARAVLARGVLLAGLVLALSGPSTPVHADVDELTVRIGGATRVHTAVEVSRAHWQHAGAAVVATARAFPDALGGTALAAALDAPLLLTEPDRLPGEVAAELVRLGARDVVLLGGEAAISAAVERSVADLPTRPSVRRIGGRDRYETAALAAREALGAAQGGEVAIASGVDFPDALVSGAMPGEAGSVVPVLLTRNDGLPAPTRALLADLQPQRVLLVGGTSALGEAVAADVEALAGDVRRLAGSDRFGTSAHAFEAALARSGPSPRPVVLAAGVDFPDALAAAALASRLEGVLLLVPRSGLTPGLDALLRSHRGQLSSAVLVGGRGAVAAHVRSEVAAALDDRPRPSATITSRGGFRAVAGPLPPEVTGRMHGVSWRPDCPVGLDGLAYLELVHHTFDGGTAPGVLVVHTDHATDVLEVFAALYEAGFPIERMRLVDDYGADDDASMDDNNTHAFNCRRVSGSSNWSEHAFGRAVDINPVQNPYVTRAGAVSPAAGAVYLDRGIVRPGMIVRPGPVVEAFDAAGWGWGGDWTTIRDYHHFSSTGR